MGTLKIEKTVINKISNRCVSDLTIETNFSIFFSVITIFPQGILPATAKLLDEFSCVADDDVGGKDEDCFDCTRPLMDTLDMGATNAYAAAFAEKQILSGRHHLMLNTELQLHLLLNHPQRK